MKKKVLFQCWVNNLPGLTKAGARNNNGMIKYLERIRKTSEGVTKVAPDWYLITNPSNELLEELRYSHVNHGRSHTLLETLTEEALKPHFRKEKIQEILSSIDIKS